MFLARTGLLAVDAHLVMGWIHTGRIIVGTDYADDTV